jgi:hypothetical protein
VSAVPNLIFAFIAVSLTLDKCFATGLEAPKPGTVKPTPVRTEIRDSRRTTFRPILRASDDA